MERDKAIIFDLDGTLADIEHRVLYVQEKPPRWDEFCKRIEHDHLNYWCLELLEAMHDKGYKILMVTGRGERYLDLTTAWLKKHGVFFDEIFCRQSKDRRSDAEIKKEIYLEQIQDRFKVLFVVDDRLSVVKMWRDDLGLTTLQCDWGEF